MRASGGGLARPSSCFSWLLSGFPLVHWPPRGHLLCLLHPCPLAGSLEGLDSS